MKKRFSEEQIISAVKKLETGSPAKEVSREMGVTIQTLYHWKKRFGGMDVTDARRLKDLEMENTRLKKDRGGPGSRHRHVEGCELKKVVRSSDKRTEASYLVEKIRGLQGSNQLSAGPSHHHLVL
ncbi:MAG: transposase [Bdellovibrionales bacterium]|nr:transposase [Bdellovibrionales bacterium]